jgi:hypothetical protein
MTSRGLEEETVRWLQRFEQELPVARLKHGRLPDLRPRHGGSALTLDKTAGYSRSGPSGTNDIVQDGTAPQNPVEIPPDNDTEEAEGRNEHRLLRWFSSSWGRIVGFFQRSDRQAPK